MTCELPPTAAAALPGQPERDPAMAEMAGELARLRALAAEQAMGLNARFAEIARLTAMLQARSAEIDRLRTAAAEAERLAQVRLDLRAAQAAMLAAPPRGRGLRGLARRGGAGAALRAQAAMIAASDLFDADWYRATYPDAAAGSLPPAEHYLRFGAWEGRNPSPRFDTLAYCLANPDVAASGLNPLVHWLVHGAAEGRPRMPGPAAPPPRDLAAEIALIQNSGQLHPAWYLATYPDVAQSGLSPAEHYLRYGAALGRNPGKHFDTTFYLETYPDVAQSGLNPLVHYALYGAAEGRQKSAGIASALAEARRRVELLAGRLLTLGFTEAPLADLAALARGSDCPHTRALAARELALWEMRRRTPEGWRAALDWLADARRDMADASDRARLVTAELLCHLALGDAAMARLAWERARVQGLVTADVELAWANFATDPAERLARINAALARFAIPPLALLPDDGRPAYDRLAPAEPVAALPAAGCPKVSVLVAAWNAEGTIATTLRSICGQSWTNLEILVIDDASTDGTAATVAALARADARIRLIRLAENGGAYVARNAGLDAATGDYVTLNDADDWSHPAKIETQVRFMEANPEVIGCTSQQARATADLGFTRWTGAGHFIIPNTSSFLFRRAPVRERFGYWDTVRFSADSELIRRIRHVFGQGAVRHLPTGPLSFQRDSETSIVADDALGINGFLFGARKEYHDAQIWHHGQAEALRYGNDPARRPFPAPAIMRADRARLMAGGRHFPVVLASEFRMHGGSVASCREDIRAQRAAGIRTGLVEMYRYDLGRTPKKDMLPEIRAEVDGATVEVLTFGEEAACDLLLLRYPPILEHPQRYLPRLHPKAVKVIVNQTPMTDYGPEGRRRYDIARCAANLAAMFGPEAAERAEWHPIGPLARRALLDHHAAELGAIRLSPQDWHNIIDLGGWAPAPRRRGPGERLRIGRHSRDVAVKWPATREDILAAYPAAGDVEVHVLGGASVPAGILGGLPDNWTVHPYGGMTPQDFLAGLDVFVYFTHPDWVESFGRAILEAMAAGVPVILPPVYRPLFREAAIYATPATAMQAARALHADPAAHAAQAARAAAFVAAEFGHEMHVRRLRAAGVGA